MSRFIIAGSVTGLALIAIAAFIGGWFGLPMMTGALMVGALGVLVLAYVWDRYAMLYDLPGRDLHEAVVDLSEVESRASKLLGLDDSTQLLGLRYAEGRRLWMGPIQMRWFIFLIGTVLFIFMGLAFFFQEAQFTRTSWICLATAALFMAFTVRYFINRQQLHCLDFEEGIFVCADGNQLHLKDALIIVRCMDKVPPGSNVCSSYELLLRWNHELLELVLLHLEDERDALGYAERIAKLTEAHVAPTQGRREKEKG